MTPTHITMLALGLCLGMIASHGLNMLQPRHITHNVALTLEKPIEARLEIEPIPLIELTDEKGIPQ